MINYKLPEQVRKIFAIFQKAGFEIYAVGGCVRDLIMGRPTKDWDFTTNATPAEILQLFPDGFYGNIFGTVGIPQENGEIYEVTTYRTERGYSDRRHPDVVRWGESLEEDLARRDFIINAIALEKVNLFKGKPSLELIDPFSGQKDIRENTIRAVGKPGKRFSEDALRLLRA